MMNGWGRMEAGMKGLWKVLCKHKRAEERALMDLHYAIMLKKNDLLTTQEEEEVKNTKATARSVYTIY